MSMELPAWAQYMLAVALALATPFVVGLIWRRLRPTSSVPFARYIPHLLFLMVVGNMWFRRGAHTSLASFLQSFLVAVLIWIVAVTVLTLVRAHPAQHPDAAL